ncbi:hypothetical protein [Rufibacter quisquiliarum]|uniref:YD repeat-containing protein n=1 Tax=Rufibacter quisquiliarum TaxID=1549639 RepID=A0A839GRZ7_9BACT|nr:hypothetical protein [Rufibacter quisquiliarum]MBA9077198.1 YD repeat-containing protein [Rufibacter quisquiliarum]
MKKSAFSSVFGFLFLVIFMGCSDDKEEPAPVSPEPIVAPVYACKLLKEQVTNGTPGQPHQREIQYVNGQVTQITEVATVNSQTSATAFRFDYDGQGHIRTTTIPDAQGLPAQVFVFDYNSDGLVQKVSWFNKTQNPGAAAPMLYSERDFTYNSAKQLVRSKHWLVTGQTPLLLNDYLFTYNAKGNLTNSQEYRVLAYQGNTIQNDIVLKLAFTHDDKVNPNYENKFLNALPPGLVLLNLSPNNVLTTVAESTLEGTQKGPGASFNPAPYNYTRTYTYTYTSENRPATQTSSQGSVRTYTYSCEKVK